MVKHNACLNNEEKIIYLLIGFILGIVAYIFIENYILKKKKISNNIIFYKIEFSRIIF